MVVLDGDVHDGDLLDGDEHGGEVHCVEWRGEEIANIKIRVLVFTRTPNTKIYKQKHKYAMGRQCKNIQCKYQQQVKRLIVRTLVYTPIPTQPLQAQL